MAPGSRSSLSAALVAAVVFACGGTPAGDPAPAQMAPAADAGMMPLAMCPPAGPYDTRVGRTLPNVILEDCEGNTHQLHDLCGKKASWFFVFASW